MKTVDKVYSVPNKNYIQFKVQMSDGAVFSAYNDKGHFNIKQMTKVVNNVLTDVSQFGGQWFCDIATTDVDVVQSAIWCMANGLLKKPDGYKCFSKAAITKANNNWLKG